MYLYFTFNYIIKILIHILSKLKSLFAIGSELSKQLEGWLSAADLSHGPARAIIAPLVVQYNIFFKFIKIHTPSYTYVCMH